MLLIFPTNFVNPPQLILLVPPAKSAIPQPNLLIASTVRSSVKSFICESERIASTIRPSVKKFICESERIASTIRPSVTRFFCKNDRIASTIRSSVKSVICESKRIASTLRLSVKASSVKVSVLPRQYAHL